MKKSPIGIDLLRSLANEELKIFTTDTARQVAGRVGIKQSYVTESLHHLLKGEWIVRLKKGVYAFSPESGFGTPHEFEIAMALVSPCAISHWTAMHYHHLTQQTPNKVFAMTLTTSSIPRSIAGMKYHFIKIKKEHFFGIEKVWIDQAQVAITDPERTLLDGLMAPQYCGDFQEVLHAFKMHCSQINLKRIVQYALRLDQATVKRLGWILEKLEIRDSHLKPLLKQPIKGYRKLDPTGPLKGPYNKKWKIQENLL